MTCRTTRWRCAYAMVENIDDNLGRLLASLETEELSEQTIVVFLTDNGANSERFNAGMRGRKGSLHEGGTRVPCFLRWPGKIPSGHTVRSICACRLATDAVRLDGGPSACLGPTRRPKSCSPAAGRTIGMVGPPTVHPLGRQSPESQSARRSRCGANRALAGGSLTKSLAVVRCPAGSRRNARRSRQSSAGRPRSGLTLRSLVRRRDTPWVRSTARAGWAPRSAGSDASRSRGDAFSS